MRSCVVLLFASLLTLCEAQGTIVTPVFVLKGHDLLLKLQADPPEGVLFVDWKINKTVNLVIIDQSGQSKVHDNFTGRVQLDENKFSVRLKNVQEVDSGVYSAVAATDTGDKLLTEYKVTVQGPVSPVELIVDRVDSSSSESCDLHVTCRTHNSNISSTFRCVDWFCSQEGGERSKVTTSGASLQVYMLHKVIICNHNNQVHRTQDSFHAQQRCPEHADSLPGWVIAVCVLIAIFIVVLLIVVPVRVWLCKDPERRIGEIKGYRAARYLQKKIAEEENRREEKRRRGEQEKKNMSPAGASGPPYSSVPSDAEPTDP